MQIIKKEDFDNAEKLPKIKRWGDENPPIGIDATEIESMINILQNPVELQKDLAAKVHIALRNKMQSEINEFGSLSESTRRWIKQYNDMLDSLQKNIHGDKSVSLHLHKISHSAIAKHVRENSGLTADEVIEAEFESNTDDNSGNENQDSKEV